MAKKRNISRRKFLRDTTCAAMGSTAFFSTALNLGMLNTLAARPHITSNSNDYKAIVCILLAGGCDTFNVLVPTQETEYDDYMTTRSSLALDNSSASSEILDLDYENAGRTFGVHGGMSGVQQMFDDGDLSFISNIGTLVEPIANATEYHNKVKQRPLGLYSHNDQIMQWQTSMPTDRSAIGFAGRMADILHDMNSIPEVAMNISLSGKNRFQTGNNYPEYSISRNTDSNNIGYDGFPYWWSNAGYLNDLKTNTINSLADQQYQNIFEKTIGNLNLQTSESIDIYRAALGNVIPIQSPFSDTNLSNDMKKIAELIQVRSHLGLNRQVFFVTYGGWDHHDNLIGQQNIKLPELSNAMAEFNEALKELQVHNDVVTFTISDFARTLTSNGNGSDHAWGGNQMVMGGPIKGSDIFGNYPSLHLDNSLNVSPRGNLIPTTSVDEFYAEMALWFGVSPNDLNYVLPNLCNFYSSSGCTVPPDPNFSPIGMFE